MIEKEKESLAKKERMASPVIMWSLVPLKFKGLGPGGGVSPPPDYILQLALSGKREGRLDGELWITKVASLSKCQSCRGSPSTALRHQVPSFTNNIASMLSISFDKEKIN